MPQETEAEQIDKKRFDPSDFDCAVCGDTYIDPRILPCGHSYCLRCIFRLAGRDRSQGVAVRCPFNCPTGLSTMTMVGDVRSMQRNVVLAESAKSLRRSRRRHFSDACSEREADDKGAESQTQVSPPSPTVVSPTVGSPTSLKDDHCEWCGHECEPSQRNLHQKRQMQQKGDSSSPTDFLTESSSRAKDSTTPPQHSFISSSPLRTSYFCSRCECTVCSVCVQETEWSDHCFLCCDLKSNVLNELVEALGEQTSHLTPATASAATNLQNAASSGSSETDEFLSTCVLSNIASDTIIHDFYISREGAKDLAYDFINDFTLGPKYHGELNITTVGIELYPILLEADEVMFYCEGRKWGFPPTINAKNDSSSKGNNTEQKCDKGEDSQMSGNDHEASRLSDLMAKDHASLFQKIYRQLFIRPQTFQNVLNHLDVGTEQKYPREEAEEEKERIMSETQPTGDENEGSSALKTIAKQVEAMNFLRRRCGLFPATSPQSLLASIITGIADGNNGDLQFTSSFGGVVLSTNNDENVKILKRNMSRCVTSKIAATASNKALLSSTATTLTPPFEARDLFLLHAIIRITEPIIASVLMQSRVTLDTLVRRMMIDCQAADVPDVAYVISVIHTLRVLVKDCICPAVNRLLLIANALSGVHDERLLRMAFRTPSQAPEARKILMCRARQSLRLNEQIQQRLVELSVLERRLWDALQDATAQLENQFIKRQRVAGENAEVMRSVKTRKSPIWDSEGGDGNSPTSPQAHSPLSSPSSSYSIGVGISSPNTKKPSPRPSLLDIDKTSKALETTSVIVWDALCSLLQHISNNLSAAVDLQGTKTPAERRAMLAQEANLTSNIANLATCLGSLQQLMLTWKRTELSVFRTENDGHCSFGDSDTRTLLQQSKQLVREAKLESHLEIIAANHANALIKRMGRGAAAASKDDADTVAENADTTATDGGHAVEAIDLQETKNTYIAYAHSVGGIGPFVRLMFFTLFIQSVVKEPTTEIRTFEDLSREFCASLFPQMLSIRRQHLAMLESVSGGGAERHRYLQEQLCALSLSSLDLFYRQSNLFVGAMVSVEGESLLTCTHALCDVMEQQAGMEPELRFASPKGEGKAKVPSREDNPIDGLGNPHDDASLRLEVLSSKFRAGGSGFREERLSLAVLDDLSRFESVQRVYGFHIRHLRGRYYSPNVPNGEEVTSLLSQFNKPFDRFHSVFKPIGQCSGLGKGQWQVSSSSATRDLVTSSSPIAPRLWDGIAKTDEMASRVVENAVELLPFIATSRGIIDASGVLRKQLPRHAKASSKSNRNVLKKSDTTSVAGRLTPSELDFLRPHYGQTVTKLRHRFELEYGAMKSLHPAANDDAAPLPAVAAETEADEGTAEDTPTSTAGAAKNSDRSQLQNISVTLLTRKQQQQSKVATLSNPPEASSLEEGCDAPIAATGPSSALQPTTKPLPLIRRRLLPFYVGRVTVFDSLARESSESDASGELDGSGDVASDSNRGGPNRKIITFLISGQSGEMIHVAEQDEKASSLRDAARLASQIITSRLFFLVVNVSLFAGVRISRWLADRKKAAAQ